MTARSSQSILILGAGLTGLAAAYHLDRGGHRVTLLDHPNWRHEIPAHHVDAPVMLLGCHQETWRLLRALDAETPTESDVVLPLEFRLSEGRLVSYRPARLPGSLQWIVGLLGFAGLTWNDRWKLFSRLEQIWEQAESLPSDLDSRLAEEWLASMGQSPTARNQIWSPLALWLTGNPITRLSAAVLVQALTTVFLGRASDARLTSLQGSLEKRLLAPLRRAVERSGVAIQSLSELPDLRFEPSRLAEVRLRDGTPLKADWYLAALAHQHVSALLPERLLTRYAYFAQIAELTVLPEIAVQFTCRSIVTKPRLLLCAESLFHQLTMTARGSHEARCRLTGIGIPPSAASHDERVIELGKTELRSVLPEIGADEIQSIEVYREDRAALSLHPGVARLRPIQKSPIQNLLVAGAWTDTGWPANLESALVSTRRCVEIITGTSI